MQGPVMFTILAQMLTSTDTLETVCVTVCVCVSVTSLATVHWGRGRYSTWTFASGAWTITSNLDETTSGSWATRVVHIRQKMINFMLNNSWLHLLYWTNNIGPTRINVSIWPLWASLTTTVPDWHVDTTYFVILCRFREFIPLAKTSVFRFSYLFHSLNSIKCELCRNLINVISILAQWSS